MKKNINSMKNLQTEEAKISNIAYRRLSDIPGYSKEALNKTFFYIKVENYMNSGQKVYIQCTKEQAYNYRNIERYFEQQENSYNKHIGNYSEPFVREVTDERGEVTVIEYADNTTPSPEDKAIMSSLINKVKSMAKDDMDFKIIQCLLSGVTTDSTIAEEVKISRSSVQERITKLQRLFNEELSDYKDSLYEAIHRRNTPDGKKKRN